MAFNGNGFASFVQGYGLGRQMVNDYQEAKDRQDLKDIADAKPEDVFQADQSNAGPMPDGSSLSETQAAGPAVKTGVRFLGKDFAGDPTDQQLANARMMASAGVMMRRNPAEAARLIQGVQQSERDSARFDREQVLNERQDTAYNKEQDYEAGKAKAFEGTYYGKNTSDYVQALHKWKDDKTAYDAAVAAGQTPTGPAPVQPTRATYTPAQSLADEAALMAHDAKFGKLDTAQFAKFTERQRQIEQEGYGKAMRLAQNGASIDEVAKVFNASGNERFDPASVVSDQVVKNAQGVPSRVISYKGDDGQVHTINTLAELDALGQAQDTFSRYFQGKADQRGDRQLALHGTQVALEGRRTDATIKHMEAQTGEITAKTDTMKELDGIRGDLGAAIDSGDKDAEAKARAKLSSFVMSSRSNLVQMAPEERKANFYLASGLAKTPADAARMAHEKVQPSASEVYQKFITAPMPLGEEQMNKAMATMYGDNWLAAVRGGGAAAASGGVQPPQAAIDYLKKNPSARADFDAKYGAGAADKALGK